jgi:biotin-(acetyl-CoA carboxylase) ligase
LKKNIKKYYNNKKVNMDTRSLFFVNEMEQIFEQNVYIQSLYNELDKINKQNNKSKKILTKRFTEKIVNKLDEYYIQYSDEYMNEIIEDYLNLFFYMFISISQLYKIKYNKMLEKYNIYIEFLCETKYYDLMKNKMKSIKKSYKSYNYDKNKLIKKLEKINSTLDELQEKYKYEVLLQDICEQYIENDHKLHKIFNILLDYYEDNTIIYNTINDNLLILSKSRENERIKNTDIFKNLYKSIQKNIFNIVENPLLLK